MSIELWGVLLNRPMTEREAAYMVDLLPGERRERLLRLRAERRREPLCAYCILRRALREQYRWEDFPEIVRTDRGKPWFPAHPEVHFSLSHTAGAVLVGLSDSPLGVDIERVRPVGRRIMERLGVSDPEAFFRCWVRREARGKCSGEGIGAVRGDEAPLRDGEFYHEVETFPGYTAGAACESAAPLKEVRRLSMDELLYGI